VFIPMVIPMIPFDFLLGTLARGVTHNQPGNIGADTTEPDPGSKSPNTNELVRFSLHHDRVSWCGECPWNVRSSFLPSPVISSAKICVLRYGSKKWGPHAREGGLKYVLQP